jgi:hypothetical protein
MPTTTVVVPRRGDPSTDVQFVREEHGRLGALVPTDVLHALADNARDLEALVRELHCQVVLGLARLQPVELRLVEAFRSFTRIRLMLIDLRAFLSRYAPTASGGGGAISFGSLVSSMPFSFAGMKSASELGLGATSAVRAKRYAWRR